MESLYRNSPKPVPIETTEVSRVTEAGPEAVVSRIEEVAVSSLTELDKAEVEKGLTTKERADAHGAAKMYENLQRFERRGRRALRRLRALQGIGSPRDMRELSEPIEAGEEFDVHEGLALIRFADKKERPAAVTEFKEKLAYQKEGIASLQEELILKLRINPNTPLAELDAWMNESGNRYGLSQTQRSYGRSILTDYVSRQEKLRAVREAFPDDSALYAELFASPPEGKVEIIDGPGTFYVRCSNQKDYARVYYSKFSAGLDISEPEIERANRSGGVSISSSRIPDLEGSIIAENSFHIETNKFMYPTMVLARNRSENIRIHEEQHAIKRFFGQAMVRTDKLDRLIDSESLEDDIRIISSYAEHRRETFAEDRARDEILAYFKDGTPYEGLRNTLTQQDGLYDYLKNRVGQVYAEVITSADFAFETEQESDLFKDQVWGTVEKVFGPEYRHLIGVGSVIPFWFRHNGFTDEQVASLLVHEPLARWEKTARRLLGDRLPKFHR